jgi:hypothetical protein
MSSLRQKVARLWPHLDERARRLFAASEAQQLGHGGVSVVSRACGLSRVTITKGLQELAAAAVNAIDYLTWNCRHIANAAVRGKNERACRAEGLNAPVICTPEELMET